jgi:hypothetical protein
MVSQNYTTAALFVEPSPPTFYFDCTCRTVLRFALEGERDESITRFESLDAGNPEMLATQFQAVRDRQGPNLTIAESESRDGKRGAEIRRTILAYVRNHPEELDPPLSRRSRRTCGPPLGLSSLKRR